MNAPSADHGLSPKELVTLRLVALGHTNPEIAERVGSSLRTVEAQRAAIRQKLGARTRADLVRFALEQGLLADPESSA
ncbi:MAG TPA: LuxR C-terminal-related transcriptional regulator [Acidimicrobiales bacterium]|nr:LuxR C-terminal-related transcriptional regulator [Acidimicrobiales bacterium]